MSAGNFFNMIVDMIVSFIGVLQSCVIYFGPAMHTDLWSLFLYASLVMLLVSVIGSIGKK